MSLASIIGLTLEKLTEVVSVILQSLSVNESRYKPGSDTLITGFKELESGSNDNVDSGGASINSQNPPPEETLLTLNSN